MDKIVWLRKESERLSQAEDTLLIRIQKILILRGEIDAEIDYLERGSYR